MLHLNRILMSIVSVAMLCSEARIVAAQDQVEPRSPQGSGAAASSNSDAAPFEVAPGIRLPSNGMVWILDQAEDKPELVRIYLSNALANRHVGENVARAELWVVKEVSTLDLLGAAARLRVHSRTPAIFIRKSEVEEEELQAAANAKSIESHYVLLRMRALEDRRELCSFSYWRFGGKRTRHENDVEAQTEEIAGGKWLEIRPKQPLPNGEYAVVRMPEDKTQAGTLAYDFGVGPLPPPAPTP
jgi:hypothetical protein